MGGISDGSDVVIRAHFKPTPSIFSKQKTVNKSGENIDIQIKGRHDPIIVPRAVVVVESMVALTVLDMMFETIAFDRACTCFPANVIGTMRNKLPRSNPAMASQLKVLSKSISNALKKEINSLDKLGQ